MTPPSGELGVLEKLHAPFNEQGQLLERVRMPLFPTHHRLC
jgi:hypothetical protein